MITEDDIKWLAGVIDARASSQKVVEEMMAEGWPSPF